MPQNSCHGNHDTRDNDHQVTYSSNSIGQPLLDKAPVADSKDTTCTSLYTLYIFLPHYAVVYFRVVNPVDSVIKVANFMFATSQIAQTTLRNVLGQSELDELLAKREKLNQMLQKIIDEHTDPWGIKVSTVEIKMWNCRKG